MIHILKYNDFDVLANHIGPRPGPVREALRAYWVDGQSQAKAASNAGVSRPTMSEYVKDWRSALAGLAGLDWDQIQRDLDAE